jgi:GNAT superfamily N-acetyltransferase
MTSPVFVRAIQPGDIESMLFLTKMMHSEGVYAKYHYDKDKTAREIVLPALMRPNTEFFYAAFSNDGAPVGFFGGTLVTMAFNDDVVAEEKYIYVIPSWRGSDAGFKLYEAFENWAKANGAARVNMTVTVGIDDEKADKFYKRLGLHQAGVSYEKEIA